MFVNNVNKIKCARPALLSVSECNHKEHFRFHKKKRKKNDLNKEIGRK